MSRKFRVTPKAYSDLLNIGRYTAMTWGEAQRDRYLAALDQRFRWLAEQPLTGRQRPDIAPGYHCFPQGQHLVFYVIRDEYIDIIGVPHESMDITSHFER